MGNVRQELLDTAMLCLVASISIAQNIHNVDIIHISRFTMRRLRVRCARHGTSYIHNNPYLAVTRRAGYTTLHRWTKLFSLRFRAAGLG